MGSDKPKKSCFNCTKRRVICDLTPPKCKKCEKKGLECPGYGVRYRFTDGKTVSPSQIGVSEGSKTASTRRRSSLKWVNVSEQVRPKRRLDTEGSDSGATQSPSPSGAGDGRGGIDKAQDPGGTDEQFICHGTQDSSPFAPPAALETTSEVVGLDSPNEADLSISPEGSAVIEVTRSDWLPTTPTFSLSMLNLPPLLANSDPRVRQLFHHFSTHVSPVMLVYDDGANGYRHQVLPLAHSDPVVERAVCVAAAFHMSWTMPELRLPAENGRAAIIHKLSTMSLDLSDATWATILLLIVADLVTGHEQVITMYKILVAFLEARGQAMGPLGLRGGSPLGEFLYYQSRVISFFAYPILGESKAITDISSILKDPMASLEHFAPGRQLPLEFLMTSNEVQASSLILVDPRAKLYIDINREATEIYLLRINFPDNGSTFLENPQLHPLFETPEIRSAFDIISPRLASIRCLFEQVDPTAPGSHAIVWPAFVAAAESRSDGDREFYTAVLQRIWELTGYANVLKGLDALPGIWEFQKQGRNWTSILPTLKTVVM